MIGLRINISDMFIAGYILIIEIEDTPTLIPSLEKRGKGRFL